MILYPETRFLSAYHPAGTDSFRLASSKLFDEWGGNGQNYNKDSLGMLVARPNHSFVQLDQDGAEARVVAYDAPAGRYRRLFELGIKVHTYVALIIFAQELTNTNKKLDYASVMLDELMQMPRMKEIFAEIKHHATIYDIAKRIVHGSSYRLGPRTMLRTILKFSRGRIRLTQAQCKAYQEIFFALFPEIRQWQQIIEMQARRNRLLVNHHGHSRRCEQIITEKYLRELISWVPQSTVGQITHNAAIEMDAHITTYRLPWMLVNQKHDSLVAECPDTDISECIEAMQFYLEQELEAPDGSTYRMKSECKVGKTLAFDA